MSSEDYARATAAPASIRLGSPAREYLVSRFSPRDIGDLQAWLKAEVRNPRDVAKELIRDVPESVALAIWKDLNEEAKDWPPSFGSEKATSLLTTNSEGIARLLWVTLRKHNPGFNLEAARALADHVDFDDVSRIIALASPEGEGDPKA